MSTQVTINSLTGTSPYDVYVCDSNVLNCVYIATISSTPYVFNVPPPLDAQSEICVKVVDINGCEIIQQGISWRGMLWRCVAWRGMARRVA